ncbi:NADH-quinone oxidoreductase subunit NuoN [Polynucleobacter sphagniphilus]|jgi:NADH-quinone oxidoreductase subunit N|uniref:NADH-quinone oxidoreductase subunit N n=1 Tax=Polynucleobacter sphagniphilus TaxID=1743169 RepID=A0AA43M9F4_9BURK|nr:NADH-quinone oxidoreductase subunit NuoN [Polynucleobacter sphagniphilus]MDF9788060.1 NADH-quinone oxidoreductase subunit N [Polynucleobacter sphagniphilus]MDH6249925.1 NADH-quinone oxidoreductase subunit N [Polynucleobacter sphagniphilus]MDH6503553.1 NADH-quinone oxidoreductase subunit N [Polynucleobacter sphagniphilus]MDH6512266.1 NADH-quinone oxidoreductase subunit N [Polynucleobacter sphagniphilus]OLY95747.1 NADH-quinone oxidoreductase subunit N [Polynucleobacter sphagniphilus]
MQAFDLYAILPELVLLITTCLLLVASVYVRERQPATPGVEQDIFHTPRGVGFVYFFALLLLAYLFFAFFGRLGDVSLLAMNGMFQSDPLSNLLKACSCAAIFVTLVYSKQYLKDRSLFRPDFIVLALLALLGQFVLISGANLLTLYLGLELMALPTYALVAMRHSSEKSVEAGIKYFILGALASGFLLYGMSMLYGITGSLDLLEIFKTVADPRVNHLVMAFGLVFIVAGLAFKLGVVPFHMWVPDVYQGAPTAVTLMIAGAPKLAAFALLFRLLVNTLLPLLGDWQPMLVLLALLSLVVGNVTAIAQTNLKRMLAYSAIAQMGFVILGMLSVFDDHAFSASLFYVVTYVMTTLGSFGLLMVLSRHGYDCETLESLKGLNKKHPWYAFIGLVMMFSLAGIPPTVGFAAKLGVLEALVDAEHTFIALIAVIASLIGAFYYLRVVKVMYFDEPTHEITVTGSGFARALLGLNAILVLVIGMFPATLMTMCLDAMRRTLLGS